MRHRTPRWRRYAPRSSQQRCAALLPSPAPPSPEPFIASRVPSATWTTVSRQATDLDSASASGFQNDVVRETDGPAARSPRVLVSGIHMTSRRHPPWPHRVEHGAGASPDASDAAWHPENPPSSQSTPRHVLSASARPRRELSRAQGGCSMQAERAALESTTESPALNHQHARPDLPRARSRISCGLTQSQHKSPR